MTRPEMRQLPVGPNRQPTSKPYRYSGNQLLAFWNKLIIVVRKRVRLVKFGFEHHLEHYAIWALDRIEVGGVGEEGRE
ncbi:unnamed protein product [Echinostoma caproni]|uniref:Transposase n=1 Tax=Echinostoma caproni TaxID=27848 RepID=A0A183AHF7_9TREM|nr:unnamed protein product [Echinostoma caproni]